MFGACGYVGFWQNLSRLQTRILRGVKIDFAGILGFANCGVGDFVCEELRTLRLSR